MGTNFYLKSTKTTDRVMKEKFSKMILENLNRTLPREREEYLIDFLDLQPEDKAPSYWTQADFDSSESYENYKNFKNILREFSMKQEVTIFDVEKLDYLIIQKIRSFTEREGYHIGKRSAAGNYCTKCCVTLSKGNFRGIHHSFYEFYKECPICHSNDNVKYACSFRWQWSAKLWEEIFQEVGGKLIVDEYGDEFTIDQFFEDEIKVVPFNMFAEEKKHVFC